jgi:prepilin-type N-terminal cleavage/methylation domain-containing protein
MKKLFTSYYKKNSAGFTIVELLIAIAIIAVLTAIVLFNVTAWINQSKDASIQGNLSSILINSSKYMDANSSYANFCTDPQYTTPSAAITAIGGTTQSCNVTNIAFCACSTLKAGGVFCVDSTGAKKNVPSTDCATECPATAACL